MAHGKDSEPGQDAAAEGVGGKYGETLWTVPDDSAGDAGDWLFHRRTLSDDGQATNSDGHGMSTVSQQWCEKGDGRRASFEGFGHHLCQRCYREFIESQASGGRINPDWGVIVKDDPRQMTLGENWRQRRGD